MEKKATPESVAEMERELIEKYGADKFDDFDCRPDRREDTGIETPKYIQEEIDQRKAAREKKSDS